MLNSHHSAADVWSLQVILQDLAECYAARKAGKEPQLPEATQYRDYVATQFAEAAGPAVAKSKEYWREALQRCPGADRAGAATPRRPRGPATTASSPVRT